MNFLINKTNYSPIQIKEKVLEQPKTQKTSSPKIDTEVQIVFNSVIKEKRQENWDHQIELADYFISFEQNRLKFFDIIIGYYPNIEIKIQMIKANIFEDLLGHLIDEVSDAQGVTSLDFSILKVKILFYTKKLIKLENYQHFKNTDKNDLRRLVRTIDILANHYICWDCNEVCVREEFAEVGMNLTNLHQVLMSIEKPSSAAREICRTPSEVIFHLLSYLERNRDLLKPFPEKTYSEAQNLVMSGGLSFEKVKIFLSHVTFSNWKSHPILAKLTEQLRKQLPVTISDMPITRLHDNIYLRCFDSALAEFLVLTTPVRVLKTIETTSKCLIKYLDTIYSSDERLLESISFLLKEHFATNPRSWFSKVPEFKPFIRSKTNREAYVNLRIILSSPKENGYDCMAVMSLFAPIFQLLEKKYLYFSVGWAYATNLNYTNYIFSQKKIVKDPVGSRLTAIAGITLAHQPSITNNLELNPSIRPCVRTRPDYSKMSDLRLPGKTQFLAMMYGLPVVTGVSGSTNIAFFFLKRLKEINHEIDEKDFLFVLLMYLTYDGGHSIHETLWTANQLTSKLKLNFRLNNNPDSNHPNLFITNYNSLINQYDGNECGVVLKKACDFAFKKVARYFDKHSYYRQHESSSTSPT